MRKYIRSAQVRAYDDRAWCRNIGVPYTKELSSNALMCAALNTLYHNKIWNSLQQIDALSSYALTFVALRTTVKERGLFSKVSICCSKRFSECFRRDHIRV